METSTTLSGASLLSCELDAACPRLDCDALSEEFAQALKGGPEAVEMVAHLCGLNYLEKLVPEVAPEAPPEAPPEEPSI